MYTIKIELDQWGEEVYKVVHEEESADVKYYGPSLVSAHKVCAQWNRYS